MKRWSWIKIGSVLAVAALAACIAAACNSGGGGQEAANNETNETERQGAPSSSAPEPAEETAEETVDPLGKYDPPIEMPLVRVLVEAIKYEPGESIDNNVWTKYMEEELGIILNNKWVALGKGPGSQGEQKMNVSIASGDLPDLIPNLNATQLKQLVDADMLMDLRDVYETYATPLVKEFINQDERSLPSATFQGKLLALPNVGSYVDQGQMVWIREDWRLKLNLPVPKTMEDVFRISEAFTKMDPDGNGADDSFGLGMDKNLNFSVGFMNGYHAFRNIWIRDSSGNLVYSGIQPEVKNALAKLQELYRNGQMDREFGVKDVAKVAESIAAGKVGLFFGGMANPLYPLQASRDNDKNAQWQAYPLVSIDDQPARAQAGFTVNDYTAVKKGAAHPEAVIKMLNAFVENIWGEKNMADPYISHGDINTYLYHPVQAWPVRKNLDKYLKYKDIFAGNSDVSILNAEEKNDFVRMEQFYNEGKEEFWGLDRIFGPGGSLGVIDGYVENDLYTSNQFYGAPTLTMSEKGSTLQGIEIETFTRIILGAPLEEFDAFVDNWKKAGGDQMTAEVNEWSKSM